MVRRLSHAPPEVGGCVVSQRMTAHLTRSCKTSRSLTLFRLLRLHLLQALPMNQPSTGGRETRLSPWLRAEVLDTTSRPISLGFELRKNVDEAYTIDKATGTTIWHDAIELEMKIVWVAFDILPDGVTSPSDHQYMKCHMIFDVKMEDFCHTA
ncbi:hypothetical protein ACHAW6_001740 [Cyclotella cf. meneghiniana]